ncbi:hypothetical protein MIDIC_60018 [Alphaproteobacteria bacterium]
MPSYEGFLALSYLAFLIEWYYNQAKCTGIYRAVCHPQRIT